MAFQLATEKASGDDIYRNLLASAKSLVEGENDLLANLANLSSLIFHSLPQLNWAGFYLLKGNELVLGPFQGKPACTRIAMGRGVCGTAALRLETIIVEDVNDFRDHIVCDSASQSEIVVPIIKDGVLRGVLDVDSPVKGRFSKTDQSGLEKLVQLVHWPLA